MEMAVEYARDRKQFGRPIGAYQAVSHRCAQMLLETEGARSASYYAAWTADAEPETLPAAASMAKAYASDAGLARHRLVAPGARRHRLHLGARPALLPEARQGGRPPLRLRRRAPRPRGRAAAASRPSPPRPRRRSKRAERRFGRRPLSAASGASTPWRSGVRAGSACAAGRSGCATTCVTGTSGEPLDPVRAGPPAASARRPWAASRRTPRRTAPGPRSRGRPRSGRWSPTCAVHGRAPGRAHRRKRGGQPLLGGLAADAPAGRRGHQQSEGAARSLSDAVLAARRSAPAELRGHVGNDQNPELPGHWLSPC